MCKLHTQGITNHDFQKKYSNEPGVQDMINYHKQLWTQRYMSRSELATNSGTHVLQTVPQPSQRLESTRSLLPTTSPPEMKRPAETGVDFGITDFLSMIEHKIIILVGSVQIAESSQTTTRDPRNHGRRRGRSSKQAEEKASIADSNIEGLVDVEKDSKGNSEVEQSIPQTQKADPCEKQFQDLLRKDQEMSMENRPVVQCYNVSPQDCLLTVSGKNWSDCYVLREKKDDRQPPMRAPQSQERRKLTSCEQSSSSVSTNFVLGFKKLQKSTKGD